MKRILSPAAAFWLTAPAVFAALPDLSVNGITGFLSDVKSTLKDHDANADGKLDAAELGTKAWMLYAIDTDKDGVLTEDELREGLAKLSRQLFTSKTAAPSETAPPPFEPVKEPRRGPRPLKASEWAAGALVPDAALLTLSGEQKMLRPLAGAKGTVVAVLSPDCPVSRRYFPELQRLEKEYAAKGIPFIFLAAPGAEEAEALRATGLTGTILTDSSGALLRTLKASRTTDVFVIDAAHTLIYRGAVDDQYGLGYSRPEPSQRYLAEALEAVLTGERPRIAATLAPGCELEFPAAPANSPPATAVTWHNRISRLMQAHCAPCHHDGGAGPFPLETQAQLLKKAKTVQRVLEEGVMPPWSAAPAQDSAHTPWLNESTLPAADKEALLAWLAGDRPEGDPGDAPLPRVWRDDWRNGTPDLVLQIPEPVQVRAEGIMPYQSVMVETRLTEDKWVSAWEVQPTAREVVHHVLVYIYPPGGGLPGAAERSGHLASWVPGGIPASYPPGFAKALPAGSRLRFEIHYTPIGKAVQDQMRLGLKFAPQPPQYVVETTGVANVQMRIPPGASAHAEAAEWRAPGDIHLLALSPHMHVRGKAMRFEATLPGGEPHTLLEVPRYDFNWQIPVAFAEPPLLPEGSVVKVTGWFDNSPANPANPNPAATVRWGSQTDDEMMIGYVEYYRLRKSGS